MQNVTKLRSLRLFVCDNIRDTDSMRENRLRTHRNKLGVCVWMIFV